ncbi:MAG: NADH-quinone oxidoreductase subunit N [Solirubrobacterales bacterium]|nr:NADH-quinone oxidoreductase subunit N [Solirubrobacterales bacterium]
MNVVAAVHRAVHHLAGPHIDWVGLSPFLALTIGALAVLLIGLLRSPLARERIVPLASILALVCSIAFEIARFKHHAAIVSGALEIDDLALTLDLIFSVAALAAVLLSFRISAPAQAGHGEYHSLLLFSVLGMNVLVSAQNLVTLFIGIELLSIPLYVLCASEFRREGSLESGLKYLVIGSVGSATLVYGLALIYGATGSTDFATIGNAVSVGKQFGGILGDPLLLTGLGLVIVGFAFKASVAPFHQWTPDVYEGAPTPITAFMATATKAAALGVFLRFFDVAAIGAQNKWAPLIAAIAAITIVVGNVGALGQSSLKRMLGYSGVAQAGYMLGGVVVGSQLGVQATVLYLGVYLAMNLTAFAVVVAQEREVPAAREGEPGSDDLSILAGLGARSPWLAWPMTVAMLSLAGIPGTVGFIGKFQLIHALIDGDYTWLAIVLVIGSMISLGYYLRVVATMWMGATAAPAPVAAGGEALAPIAGGSPAADAGAWPTPARSIPYPEVAFVALLFAAASVLFGIVPSPLFHLAAHAGHALSGIF